MEGQSDAIHLPNLLRGLLPPAGLAFALFVAPSVIPVMGEFLALFTPTPLALAALRWGWRVGAIAGLLAMGAVTLLFGNSAALLFGVQYVVAAVVMADALRRRFAATVVVAGSVSAMALAGGVIIGIVLLATNEQPFASLASAVDRMLQQTLQVYQAGGPNAEDRVVMRRAVERFGQGVKLLLPGLLVGGAILNATANFLAVRRVLQRTGLAAQFHEADLGLWSAPRAFLRVAVLASVALVVPFHALRIAAANVLLVLLFVYFLQGFAVTHFYLARGSLSRAFRIAGYVAVVVAPLVVTALGVFDSWFNFRRVSRL